MIAGPVCSAKREEASVVNRVSLCVVFPYRYPYNLAQLYPSVRTLGYPYNLDGLYPSVVKTQESARVASVSALAAKSTTKRSSALLGTRPIVRQTIYPVFDLYPAAYPHNLLELYPPVLTSVLQPTQSTPTSNGSPAVKKQATSAASRVPAKLSSDARVRLSPQYPTFDLFPAVYPHNLDCIYPTSVKTFAGAVTPSNKSALATKPIAKSSSASPEARPVVCQKGYPVFDLYPAVYPYNLLELYPPVLASISQSARSAGTINGNSTVGKQATSDTPCAPAKRLRDVRVRFPPQYPVFDLFPAVYPHNLDCIYPTYIKALVATAPVSSKGTLHKELSVPEPVHTTSNVWDNTQSVYFARVYPNIELYAPVYPFNLDIYPSVRAKSSVAVPMNSVLQQKVSEAAAGSNTDKEVIKPAPKTRKTHAQLYAEARRKTHAQLVAEVAKDTAPARIRKTHDELQAEVSPGGLPSPVITAATSPQVMVTLAMNSEPSSAPQPAVAPLRRQRSGTIMMRGPPALAESVPPVPPLPQGTDLARSRSMLEARTQMFERTAAPARSQTISAPRLVRGKNASFERAMSLFHEETGKTGSEGSRTPPRVSKTISKLDMSKFKFS
ncbi:hypothetical protein FRC09_010646 [Ceratobasidium sp. 395]|nr:hypothetical protein FRC09_010646 [Ceratobasidium sp. 395]